ncbi:hypothetical protein [Micromonospora sp. NBC_01412]|uniref:hypothetical protein n=1 Tax=Micromonospora sp. NBC_01412 TaxID=2903590 RepID=UPI003254D519
MWGIAERRGATTIELSAIQMALVQVVYDEFRKQAVWPTMYAVDRAFIKAQRRGVLGATTVMRGLPEGLLMQSHIRPDPAPQDAITLTISGVARCSSADSDVEAFLRSVRWCARQEIRREPEPGETSIKVNRQQMLRAIPLAFRTDSGSLDRLFTLLSVHNWGSVGSCRPSDGAPWYLNIGTHVRRFRNVQSVEEFIDVLVTWDEEERQRHRPTHQLAVGPVDLPPVTRAYLNPKVLDHLRGIDGAAWDISKLSALADELDTCVGSGCVFAAHAVLRALLDHVPPLFGQKTFAGVVSSHPWGKTDGRYLNRLSFFRTQGDDALHRQISKRPDLLMIDDLPEGAAVNALLQGCIAQLQKQ